MSRYTVLSRLRWKEACLVQPRCAWGRLIRHLCWCDCKRPLFNTRSRIHFWRRINMTDVPVQHRARLIFDPAELAYDFGSGHPFQAQRLVALMDLLEKSGLWDSANEQTGLPVRAATI